MSPRCSTSPPEPACATEVANQLGFRLAWILPPSGWTAGQPGDPGFIGRFGEASPVVEELLHRGGVTMILASGGTVVPPRLPTHGAFTWRGVRVREMSGMHSSPGTASRWGVSYRWSMHTHPYRLIVEADPSQGPVGTLARGLVLARRLLDQVRFARPAATPSGA